MKTTFGKCRSYDIIFNSIKDKMTTVGKFKILENAKLLESVSKLIEEEINKIRFKINDDLSDISDESEKKNKFEELMSSQENVNKINELFSTECDINFIKFNMSDFGSNDIKFEECMILKDIVELS